MVRVLVVLWVTPGLLLGIPLALALLDVKPLWLIWIAMTAVSLAPRPFIHWVNTRQAELRDDPASCAGTPHLSS